MMTLKINCITVEEYLNIRAQVQWRKLLPEQAKLALDNSLRTVAAYDNDRLVGMGRIVGDGAVICYVQDLIVIPEYQRHGVGSMVLQSLISFVESLRMKDSQMMLCLMCAKGREGFYEANGFTARPTSTLGPGMIQYLHE